MVKHLATMWKTRVRSLGWEDPLEKEMATHSSIVAWKMPLTEEPGTLQFMGLQRSPGGGHGNPLQYACLENPHGQRRLAGYSPWGHKESDTTEPLSTHTHIQNV